MIEVEYYRRKAESAVGRVIATVDAPDAWYLKRGTTAEALSVALVDRAVVGARRIGKLLLLDTGGINAKESSGDPDAAGQVTEVDGPTLGLRFGMTGRLVVDGAAAVDRLEYASARDKPIWDRFALRFTDGGVLRIQDPRRLGGVELDPDEDRLGADARDVGLAALRRLLANSIAPLKARLLDQARLAGVGNLICDETLWRAGLDPARPAGSLSDAEARRLHRHLRATVTELLDRGGSHTGDLHLARARGALCPRDGTVLDRRTIGGRTTYSCPRHQR